MKMKRSLSLKCTAILAVWTVAVDAIAQPIQYTVEVIDMGQFSEVIDINNHSQLVGQTVSANWTLYGFLYEHGVLLNTTDRAGMYPLAINDSGEFVAGVAGSGYALVMWTGQGTQRIYFDAVHAAHVLALNNAGEAVGYTLRDKAVEAALFQEGATVSLGEQADFGFSMAYDINTAGQIVGTGRNGSEDDVAFSWQDGVMVLLPTLDGSASARGINDRGIIVGHSAAPNETFHAVMWQDSEIIDLGTLSPSQDSIAEGINNVGTIIGNTTDGTGFVILDARIHQLTDVVQNPNNWKQIYANDINDAGQIVGYAITNANRRAAVVLSPID